MSSTYLIIIWTDSKGKLSSENHFRIIKWKQLSGWAAAAVTVTVCAVLQSAAVKVSDGGAGVTTLSCVAGVTVTSPVGSLVNATV